MNESPAVADLRIGVAHADPARPEAGDLPDTDPGAPARARGLGERLADRAILLRPETVISLVVVLASMAWIASVLHPRLILTDTTPTGGDMGAHVWAPAYLRDHLIPNGRLIGWTPDWYAGFPAFQYYMILPSLSVVLLNVGVSAPLAVLVVVLLVAGLAWVNLRPPLARLRGPVAALAVAIAVLSIGLPYGVAFKLVVVSGLVTMPLNAWAMGRLAGMAFPGPVLLAVATLPFVFDRSFNIYGGNIASTMAGEFAFSMALSLSLLAIGCTVRAIDTGKGRGWAALTLTLTGLCHLFPAFFALGVVCVVAALRVGRTQLKTLAIVLPVGGALGAFWALPFLLKSTYMNDMGWGKLFNFKANLLTRNTLPSDFLRDSPPLEVVFALAVVGLVLSVVRANRLGVALAVGAAAVALAFVHRPEGRLWNGRMLPFYYLSLYFLAAIALAEAVQLVREKRWARYFAAYALIGVLLIELARAFAANQTFEANVGRVLPGPDTSMWGVLLVGLLAGVLWSRRHVAGLALACGCALVWMTAQSVPESWWTSAQGGEGFFSVAGESVLRPSTYAVLHALEFPAAYVLAGMVVVGLVDLVRDTAVIGLRRQGRVAELLAAPVAFLGIFAVLAPALHSVPFGNTKADGSYEWGLPGWRHSTKDVSFLSGWAKWNFEGYERKPASATSGGYAEFYDLVQMTERVGQDPALGCGRSMWEYGPRLEGYGTPMAPMLIPHYTDGCIGSMEGLYFEASSTTPFHFLNQSALSKQPSSPQRDLPYPGFDIDLGVQQLQLMGVRYYLAFSDTAVAAAQKHPDLREIAVAGVWHMFLVADSDLVSPLAFEPVVYDNVGPTQHEWLQPAAKFFDDPAQWDVLRAATGPESWARFTIPEDAKLDATEITERRAAAEAEGGTYDEPVIPDAPRTPLPAVTVSGISTSDDSIEFDVDQVGVPVLVKASYFPNWKVSGGEGPYRVTPNLMVVVPTSTHVRLHYGYTGIDLFAMALTAAGIVALVVVFRRRPEPAGRAWLDPLGAIASRGPWRVGVVESGIPVPPIAAPEPPAGDPHGPAGAVALFEYGGPPRRREPVPPYVEPAAPPADADPPAPQARPADHPED